MPDHVPSLLDVLVHTPLWVWALFAFVLFMGYQRTRDRTVPLWRILLLPAVLGLISLSGMLNAGLAGLPAIALGLIAGGTVGWLRETAGATLRLADGRVRLRGDWGALVQIALILAFRYAMAIMPVVNPELAADPTWHLATQFIAAGLTAMFIGRAAARLRVYFTSAPAVA